MRVLSIVLVILLGALHLPHPLGGDQALFLAGAKAIEDGATLYRDFWDLKQPGIYLFFWLGGKLFGFTEYGIHLFECLYLAAFALVIAFTARNCLSRWAVAVAPLAAAGSYYLIATPWTMSQVEYLAAFPLYCAFWFIACPYGTLARRIAGYAAAGVSAACAAMFKLAFLPIVFLAVVVTTLWLRAWTQNSWRAIVLQRWVPMILGFAAACAPVLVWLNATGGYDRFLWTTFEYPIEAMRMGGGKSWTVLGEAIQWFLLRFGVWLAAAGFAFVVWSRQRGHLLPLLLVLWLIAGFGVIAIQRISWWPYHFQLLIVPTALLALYGLDKANRRPWLTAIVVIAAFAPGAALFAKKGRSFSWDALLNRRDAVLEYQRSVHEDYERAWQDTRILAKAEPGAIYVFGNPLYLLLADRKQAIPENGWGWETATASQWENLPRQLGISHPAWIFVDAGYLPLMRQRGSAVLALLESDYELAQRGPAGAWYRAKQSPSSGVY